MRRTRSGGYIPMKNKVKSLEDFPGVPAGTLGYVIDDYGTGITVAWDLPDRPYPHDLAEPDIANLPAIHPKCPLRDGFDKKSELHLLEFL